MYHSTNSKNDGKVAKDLFVWAFVLVAMVAIAAGDVEQLPIQTGAYRSMDSATINSPPAQPDLATGEVIQSIKFNKGQEITDALRVLAATYQKNIVPSAQVKGLLGFTTLTDVTFEDAMDAVLGEHFAYEQQGCLIKVYTADEYKKIKQNPDRMMYKVFTLYYIKADDAEKLIKPVLSSSGTIQCSSAAETGISTSEKGVGGEAGGNSMALHDTLIVYDYPENIAKAQKVLESLDVRPKQVLIEATILSATLTEGMSLGIDLNFLGGVNLDGTAATADLTSGNSISRGAAATNPIAQIAAGVAGAALETAGFATAGGNGLRVGVRSGNISAFITALESITDITVLANPKILALNKQVGTVFIGTKLGYRSQTTQTDTSTTQKVVFLDTGTKLSFRPYIADDGYIRMDIYPKDSSGELDSEGIPTETTAELTTNVMVRDGQTIVIGGLFRDDIRTIRSQIPLLGDLPLIGAAFRGTTDSTVRQEIIVLLTPHIISDPEQVAGDDRAADVARKRYGARTSLQWVGRTRLADDHYVNAVSYYADGNNVEALCELDQALELRPTYLEALRLKERIITEIAPDEVGLIERIMLGVIEAEQTPMWRRW